MSVEYKLAILGMLCIIGVLVVRRFFRHAKIDSDAATQNSVTANQFAVHDQNDPGEHP